MKCPDCKGTGKYVGAGTQPSEDCQRCSGLGLIGPGASHEAEKRSKNKALDSVFKANKLPDWMEDYKDEIDVRESKPFTVKPSDLERFRLNKQRLTPDLNIGDTVHVFDCEWIEVTVMNFNYNHADQRTHYYAKYACGTMTFTTYDLSYNVTAGRWEIIKAGTPVWP